jgi:thiol-disulfide isomerase/thioredoxin
MKKLIFVFLLVVSALVGADEFTLKTFDGVSVKAKATEEGVVFDKYKGKIVFLAFWGKNCPPCLMEIPGFVKLQEKFKKDVVILAMHVQKKMSKEEMADFIFEHKINYPVVPVSDSGMELVNYIAYQTGWQGQIPFMVIFDGKGVAQNMHMGLMSEEYLEREIEGYISKK